MTDLRCLGQRAGSLWLKSKRLTLAWPRQCFQAAAHQCQAIITLPPSAARPRVELSSLSAPMTFPETQQADYRSLVFSCPSLSRAAHFTVTGDLEKSTNWPHSRRGSIDAKEIYVLHVSLCLTWGFMCKYMQTALWGCSYAQWCFNVHIV